MLSSSGLNTNAAWYAYQITVLFYLLQVTKGKKVPILSRKCFSGLWFVCCAMMLQWSQQQNYNSLHVKSVEKCSVVLSLTYIVVLQVLKSNLAIEKAHYLQDSNMWIGPRQVDFDRQYFVLCSSITGDQFCLYLVLLKFDFNLRLNYTEYFNMQ